MCIAIYKAPLAKLSKETLETCFKNNTHGAGLCYPKDGKMEIRKGFFTFAAFWAAYEEIRDLEVPALLHCRYKTDGIENAENCHPWRVNDETALIHNGIIKQHRSSKKDKISDTGLFVRDIIKPMCKANKNAWKRKWAKALIEEYIGLGNKLVMLDASGHYEIFRPLLGEWNGGCWFSNDGYKERKSKVSSYLSPNSVYGPKTSGFSESDLNMTEIDEALEKFERDRLEVARKALNLKKDQEFATAGSE